MPYYTLSLPIRDCGHWSDPVDTEVNYTSLRRRADKCEVCRALLQWIRRMYLSRCEQEPGDPGMTVLMDESNREPAGLTLLRDRLLRKLLSGAGFSIKLVWDLTRVVFHASSIVLGPIAYLCIQGCLLCCSCCGCWLELESSPWIKGPYPRMRQALRDLVGIGYGNESQEQSSLDADLVEQTFSVRGANGRACRFKKRIMDGPSATSPLRNGCSGIIIEANSVSDEMRCIIYCHTYRPRGPVGSMIYFSDVKLYRPMNHPTHFLSLAGGRLFFTRWNSERHRFENARSFVGASMAKKQGQIYEQGHSGDHNNHDILPLPTRLIDIGDPGDPSRQKISHIRASMILKTVKLWTTPADCRGQYVALTHRWGSDESWKLTKDSLHAFQNGLAFSDLPKTYQDAMVVAQRLGYRYIWIDALCIVQDDPEDWLRESTRMASVYRNASCTLAAHTARCSNTGFLDATLERVPTLQIRSKDSKGRYISNLTLGSNFNDQVAKSFLSRRGWVFQERILSRRVLHFVRHHIFFEDESGLKADDLGGTRTPLFQTWNHKLNIEDSFSGFHYWYKLVEQYSSCSLTLHKDRLPAIASLAKDFSQRNKAGRYLFGLWENSLHLGLLWIDVTGIPSDLASPSWSWARWIDKVLYPQTLSDSFMKAGFSLTGNLRSEDQPDADFHGITDESRALSLDGLLLELHKVSVTINLEPIGNPFFDPPVQGLCRLNSSTGAFGSWVALDGKRHGAFFQKLSCLLVCTNTVSENDFLYRHHQMHYFLLLQSKGDGSSAYHRVGVGVTTQYLWTDDRTSIIIE